MCGITGWWSKSKKIDIGLFNSMRDTLTHRGPDGFGTYYSENNNIALGHRRLAFIDLSDNAAQPICNEDGTILLSLNGEIYNYTEIKQKLPENKHHFKSQSDSEVLLHAYEEWGTDMIPMLEGMFAFALWDENKNLLILARDRFGIKPLYYYKDENQIIFASEIKAIISNPDIKREIDYSALCDFLKYRYVPSPKSIFKNIYKIEPATYLEINNNFNCKKTEYFKFNISNRDFRFKDLVKEVERILSDSVKIHIRSDVPIGSFLSGGYDSTAMVHFYKKHCKNFNTFSIGFKDWENSEDQYAKIISEIYETNHFKQILNETSFDVLEKLMYYYDEPIADISIIPTYFVSQLARKENKAVLSGEGADELFAGYTWHRKYLWHISRKQIRDAKKWGWELPVNYFDIESYSKAMAMGEFNADEMKQLLTPALHQYIPENTNYFYEKFFNEDIPAPKRFQILDIKGFMGELVLTKVDRASMANSLEVRVPFLNTKLCNLMLSLSPNVYFDEKIQKPVIRKILKKKVPRKILNRKKQGFTGPDQYYMNFEKYRKILNDSTLIRNNIINKEPVENYFQNKDHWRLWKISVLELWYKTWISQ